MIKLFTYIKFDENGFVTAYQTTEADGFTKVLILDSWINKFAVFFSKFRYDMDKKVVLNPGNLPEVSLTELNSKYDDVLKFSQITAKSVGTLSKHQTATDTSIDQLTEGLTALAVTMATKEDE